MALPLTCPSSLTVSSFFLYLFLISHRGLRKQSSAGRSLFPTQSKLALRAFVRGLLVTWPSQCPLWLHLVFCMQVWSHSANPPCSAVFLDTLKTHHWGFVFKWYFVFTFVLALGFWLFLFWFVFVLFEHLSAFWCHLIRASFAELHSQPQGFLF